MKNAVIGKNQNLSSQKKFTDDSYQKGLYKGKNLVCYSCGISGHKSSNFISKQQNKLWCKLCKNATHNDRSCRKQKLQSYEQIKQCKDDKSESHSFVFTLKNEFEASDKCNTLLVDCGATAHIVTDDSNFCYIDEAFKPDDHYIELADGTKSNNIALKRGNVKHSSH